MKIWQVTENDTQMRFYWYATKREAEAHARKYRAEERAVKNSDPHHHYTVEVEACTFPAGRAGLVKAMNWVITMTCFNEG